MKSSKVRIILALFIAVLTVMPASSAFAGPANVEYGYETIPGINDRTSPAEYADQAIGGSSANQAVGQGEGDGSNFIGVLADSWILFVLLTGLALALGYYTWRRRDSRGSTSGLVTRVVTLLAVLVTLPLITLGSAQSANRATAPKGFFGIITQTELTAPETTRMAKGGIESIRLPLSWPSIQPENGTDFNWEGFDGAVGLAAINGMSALPFLYDAPRWSTGRSNTYLPTKGSAPGDWSRFVTAAVERYGRNGTFWDEHGSESEDPVPYKPIRVWQIWNEANFFYFADPVSPAAYLTVLELAGKAIKEADPSAKIMLTGLYGSPPSKQIKRGKAMVSYKFLDKLYGLGAKQHFDIAALHPYTPNTGQTRILVDRFRQVMARNGDRGAPMSITEVGWGSARKGFLDVGSPAKQAKQVRSAYNYFLNTRRKTKLQSVYWFAWKDKKRSEPSCNFCYSTGLFGPADGLKPKPAWKAFTRFTGGRP